MARSGVVVRQGDVFWVELPGPRGSEPPGRRPALVIQHDRFNATRLGTVAILAITSSLRLAGLPGNVRLRKGEANLPLPSVVNVTQVHAIDREFVRERLGTRSRARMKEIWDGVKLVLEVED